MADRSFSERLGRESEAWVAEGVISAEQAATLRKRYAGTAGLTEPRSRATVALATVGAIAVGLGVVGFFAANWDGLSHGLRLLLLTTAIAGAYAAAFQLRDRTAAYPRVGEALYLLGVLLFGASLFLVGQMYNVEAHDPFALLLWAGGRSRRRWSSARGRSRPRRSSSSRAGSASSSGWRSTTPAATPGRPSSSPRSSTAARFTLWPLRSRSGSASTGSHTAASSSPAAGSGSPSRRRGSSS